MVYGTRYATEQLNRETNQIQCNTIGERSEKMTQVPLTLMTVHAHPDDESIGTGGILAKYSAEGIHTVLVHCTRGETGQCQ